jgi:hypothetical protein
VKNSGFLPDFLGKFAAPFGAVTDKFALSLVT